MGGLNGGDGRDRRSGESRERGGRLPYSGPQVGLIGLLGAAMIAAGLGLRRAAAPRARRAS